MTMENLKRLVAYVSPYLCACLLGLRMHPLGSGTVTPPFVSHQLHYRLTLNIPYHTSCPEHGLLPVLEPVCQSS